MSKMVRIRLNGKKVKAPAGSTILEVARLEGLDIPTLCHSPLLRPLENCRLCVVKVEGEKKFKAACSTPVSEDMDITTHSDELFQTRKVLLELLLDTHYGDCLAPCSIACPASVDIQGYLALIRHGEFREAVRLVKEKIPMPASIGRVCPQFCAEACRRHLVDEPIQINPCKRFLSDYERNCGERILPQPLPETGFRVAVIGGGPSGLSAAYYLRTLGHGATIFEERGSLGGMLRYGIPEYRLPKKILDWEIEGILSLGVGVKTGQRWGRDFTLEDLKKDGYNAVFLGIGAWAARKLGIVGEELNGVIRGIDFLEQICENQRAVDVAGKRVVVIGGGNVAIDAARTSLRLGADKVTILYRRSRNEMPAAREEIEAAEEEGVDMQYLAAPTQLIGENGTVRRMEYLRMELGEPDAGGRRRPVPIEGSETMIGTDQVISAIGQFTDFPTADSDGAIAELPLTRWGTFGGDPRSMHTGHGMVFVGGDVFRGPATVVAALADGRKAAYSLDRSFRVGAVEPEPLHFNISKGDLKAIDRAPFNVVKTASRETMPHIDIQARIGNFREVELGYSDEQARKEAGRCLTCGCTAAFDCRLRDMMYLFEVDWRNQPSKKISYQRVALVDTHPDIALDPNKCIRCERCREACDAFQCSDAVTFKDWPRFNENCVHCGLCLDLCPTGAISEKQDGRAVDRLDWRSVKTHCVHCGMGCELSLKVAGNRVSWISDGANMPPNWASTCRRGRFRAFDSVWRGERVLSPMVRKGKKLGEVSWEKGIEKLLEGFNGVNDKFGANAIGALASPRSTNESLYLLQKWMRAGWKSNSIDFPGRETREKLRALLEKLPNVKGISRAFSGLREADLFLVVGDKVEETTPVVAAMMRRAVRGGNVPVLQLTENPDSLTPLAKVSIQARPGTWNSLVQELGRPAHSRGSGKDKPIDVSKLGVSAQQWKEFEQSFAAAASPAVVFSASMLDSQAADVVESLVKIAGGAGIYALDSEINSTGALMMGISPARLPGFAKVTDRNAAKGSLESALEQGLIKALFVQDAASLFEKDAKKWAALFKSVAFLVLQESVPSPAMSLAQVVLPVAAFGEQKGTVLNVEGRLLDLDQAFEPQGSSIADWEILAKIMSAQKLADADRSGDLDAIHRQINSAMTLFPDLKPQRKKK